MGRILVLLMMMGVAGGVSSASTSAPVVSTVPVSTPKLGRGQRYGRIGHEVLYAPGDAPGLGPGDSGPDVANVRQGDVGDCYFLSSEMAVAQRFPGVIRARMQAEADGTYSGNFFGTLRGAKGRFVARVSGDLPEDRRGELVDNAVERIGGESVAWAAISEKLWAVVNEISYKGIEGIGDSSENDTDIARGLYALTGKEVVSRSVAELTPDQLREDEVAGVVVIGTAANDGLLEGDHAFAVLGVDAAGEGEVELGNPEGGRVKISFAQLTRSNVNQYLTVALQR